MIGIREFFVGKTIFLTGVTGLVGKLVLEKLLRCCEGVEKIYILVRAKKGKDASQRIKEICDTLVSTKYLVISSNKLLQTFYKLINSNETQRF